jgi:hypothetical protein
MTLIQFSQQYYTVLQQDCERDHPQPNLRKKKLESPRKGHPFHNSGIKYTV